MFLKSSKSADHLFLHCPTALLLWYRLLCIANLEWSPLGGIVEMLRISFKGFKSLPTKREGSLAYGYFILDMVYMVREEYKDFLG